MTIQRLKQKLKKVKLIYMPYIHIRKKISFYKMMKSMKKFGDETFRRTVEALSETDLCWFCAFGTLLGFVRDGDFIKWDLDIDIGIIDNDLFSWTILENAMEKYGFKKIKQFTYKDKITEQTYVWNNCTVDFFLFMKKNNGLYINRYYRAIGKTYNSDLEYSLRYICVPEIKQTKPLYLKGMNFPIPENYEKHLEYIYGKNWMVPDPNFKKDVYEVSDEIGYCEYFRD